MANEDPSGIPEQIRQTRPFIAVLVLAILIAVGGFLFVLSMDTESKDIGRNVVPPKTTSPDTPVPAVPPAE